MVKWIGEKTADFLLAFLLGIIPLIVIRDFERERRIATMEAQIVGEPRIVLLEEAHRSTEKRLEITVDETRRLRQGINDMLLPIFADIARRGINDETSSSNSRFDVEPLPDGGPE